MDQENVKPREHGTLRFVLNILSYVLGLPFLASLVWLSYKITGLMVFPVVVGLVMGLAVLIELYAVFASKRNHLPLFLAGLWALGGVWVSWLPTENMRMILYMILAVILYFVIMWVINDGHGVKGLFLIHRSQIYFGLAMWFTAFARFQNQPDVAFILMIAVPFYLWIGLAFHMQEKIYAKQDGEKSFYESDGKDEISFFGLWFYRLFTLTGIVCAVVVILFFKFCREHQLLEAKEGQPAPTFLGLLAEVADVYQKGGPPPPNPQR
ncbi:hypothetical protein QQ056_17710 [Oscillatoria laete-virens NRMC-F 0139]|nr:hypothetical protein [Oscillatoria laete-virens]MDL5055370.1 hypothetical protein [Oscillatoria laete-virens NRMC-F 0139]